MDRVLAAFIHTKSHVVRTGRGGHWRYLLYLVNRYEGKRTKAGTVVTVNGEPLDLRLDLHNHSPTGFDWGYCGSGPAQLALAILADHLANDERALVIVQRFKWVVIAELPRNDWILTGVDIHQALMGIGEQESPGGPT
jgi:hypothetical protein